MAFKTILVHAEPRSRSDARLKASAGLAAKFGGVLLGVGAIEYFIMPDPAYGAVSPQAQQALLDQIRDDLREAEAAFRAEAAAGGVNGYWRSSMDLPVSEMVRQAHAADLAVVTRSEGQDQRGFVDGGALVMSAGIPILVLPPALDEVKADTILVAWKNSRESRRALADALPFLKRARRVVIASIQEQADAGLQAELDDVAERLRRHGVAADTDISARLPMSVSDQLFGLVQSQKVDLVVAGAYGHTRLREWVFGGVTERLLHHCPVAVLLSR